MINHVFIDDQPYQALVRQSPSLPIMRVFVLNEKLQGTAYDKRCQRKISQCRSNVGSVYRLRSLAVLVSLLSNFRTAGLCLCPWCYPCFLMFKQALSSHAHLSFAAGHFETPIVTIFLLAPRNT